MNLIDRINNLAKKFAVRGTEADQQIFRAWKDETTKALLIKDLNEHEAIKSIVAELNSKIKEMELLLLSANSTQLDAVSRDRLLDKRELYEWFRSYFATADSTLARIEREITINEENNKHHNG